MWQILQLFYFPHTPPPPPKWINLISNWLSTVSIKYKNWPSPVFGRFQNGNWTSCRAILVWNCTCDFSQNCTPLSSITIINTRCGIWLIKAHVVLIKSYFIDYILFFFFLLKGMECAPSHPHIRDIQALMWSYTVSGIRSPFLFY